METTPQEYDERRKALVSALRSGDYQQAQGFLHRIDVGHCCLGVACDLYRQRTGIGRWVSALCGDNSIFETPGKYLDSDIERSSADLPGAVREYFGFKSSNGSFFDLSEEDNEGPAYSLVELNDSGASFRTIADNIENDSRGLFVS